VSFVFALKDLGEAWVLYLPLRMLRDTAVPYPSLGNRGNAEVRISTAE
jgi:hypothetical protein